MQLTRPLHEDSPQWEWFKRAVVTTIKKNGKVDYDTKIRLTSTIIWCLGAFDVVRKTINLTYQGKVAPWNAKYNIVEKKTRQKYPDTLKGRIALNKVLFAFFRASQVEKNTDTGTEAITMFGTERYAGAVNLYKTSRTRMAKLARTGMVIFALGHGLTLAIQDRNANKAQEQPVAASTMELAKVPSYNMPAKTNISSKLKTMTDKYDKLNGSKKSLNVKKMETIKETEDAKARAFEEEFYGKDGYKKDLAAKEQDVMKQNAKHAEKIDSSKSDVDTMLNEKLSSRNYNPYNTYKNSTLLTAKMYKDGYRNTKHMQFSNKGWESLKELEGFRTKAYKDSGGRWTIGYGHTGSMAAIGIDRNVQEGDEITEEQARILAMNGNGGINKVVETIQSTVNVRLKQNEFDALVLIVYNIGISAWKNKSTLLGKVNQLTPDIIYNKDGLSKMMDSIKASFTVWNTVNNVQNAGLTTRRNKEFELFKNGKYPKR